MNGSHTQACPENTAAALVCWCCLRHFPSHWACLWNRNGSRCFDCEHHEQPCLGRTGWMPDDTEQTRARYAALEAEAQRLCEALAFYADPATWVYGDCTLTSCWDIGPRVIDDDAGRRAREALKK